MLSGKARIIVDEAHQRHSSLREKVVEHVFVGEALRALWRRGIYDVEVLRSEFDAHGYDLVMARGQIVRHIQFKTGVRHRPGRLSMALHWKPSPAAALCGSKSITRWRCCASGG